MLTLSGPMELFFSLFIVTWTCVVVSVMLVVCSLFCFVCLCLTVLVNCFLNAFAICVGEECFLFESYGVVCGLCWCFVG